MRSSITIRLAASNLRNIGPLPISFWCGLTHHRSLIFVRVNSFFSVSESTAAKLITSKTVADTHPILDLSKNGLKQIVSGTLQDVPLEPLL